MKKLFLISISLLIGISLMGQNIYPISPLTPTLRRNNIRAANTARDGSGTLVVTDTGSTYGTRIDKITFISNQLTAAASSGLVARTFICDSIGNVCHLYNEVVITTITASTTVIGAKAIIITGGLILPKGYLLKHTISVHASAADDFEVFTEGGKY